MNKIDKLQYISQATKNGTHLEAIEEVLKSGGQWIQLRIKDQSEAQVLQYALEAKLLCDFYGAKLVVNDYPDIARKAGCYGVHLGLQDMPIKEARKIIGSNGIIGGTANTFAHIQQRVAEGADYIGLGPYRFTTTKQNLSPVIGLAGYLDLMEKVQDAGIQIPIIAIGGIESKDIPEIIGTGVYGVALSGALTNQENTIHKISDIYYQLEGSKSVNNTIC